MKKLNIITADLYSVQGTIYIAGEMLEYSNYHYEHKITPKEYFFYTRKFQSMYNNAIIEIDKIILKLDISQVEILRDKAEGLIIALESCIKNVNKETRTYYKYNIEGLFLFDYNFFREFFICYYKSQLKYSLEYLEYLNNKIILYSFIGKLELTEVTNMHDRRHMDMKQYEAILYYWMLSKLGKNTIKSFKELIEILIHTHTYKRANKKVDFKHPEEAISKLKSERETFEHFRFKTIGIIKKEFPDLSSEDSLLLATLEFPYSISDKRHSANVNW